MIYDTILHNTMNLTPNEQINAASEYIKLEWRTNMQLIDDTLETNIHYWLHDCMNNERFRCKSSGNP